MTSFDKQRLILLVIGIIGFGVGLLISNLAYGESSGTSSTEEGKTGVPLRVTTAGAVLEGYYGSTSTDVSDATASVEKNDSWSLGAGIAFHHIHPLTNRITYTQGILFSYDSYFKTDVEIERLEPFYGDEYKSVGEGVPGYGYKVYTEQFSFEYKSYGISYLAQIPVAPIFSVGLTAGVTFNENNGAYDPGFRWTATANLHPFPHQHPGFSFSGGFKQNYITTDSVENLVSNSLVFGARHIFQ